MGSLQGLNKAQTDSNMNSVNNNYVGNAEEIEAKQNKVKNQGKILSHK